MMVDGSLACGVRIADVVYDLVAASSTYLMLSDKIAMRLYIVCHHKAGLETLGSIILRGYRRFHHNFRPTHYAPSNVALSLV